MNRAIWMALAAVALGLLLAACSDDNPSSVTPTGTTLPGEPTAIDFGVAPMGTFAERCQPSEEKQFTAPEHVIDTSKTYVATIKTEKGDIVLELFSDVPITTNNFVFLACKGFYDGVTFHRVLPGFVAQGGDPTGSGSGGPGYNIPDEDDGDHAFDAAVISMAKAGPNTTGSQFFITYTPQPGLASGFTVFGKVTEGMDVAESLTPRDPQQNPNAPPGDTIESITVVEQ